MAFEWVLAGFSALTAALIGWQIFSLLSIKRAIREQIQREIPEFEIPVEDIRRLFRVVGVIKRNII